MASLDNMYAFLKPKALSRLGLIKLALKRGSEKKNINQSARYLLEYNPNKFSRAEDVFGVPLAMLNPYSAPYPISYRMVFLLIVPFGEKYRDILFALIVRFWVEKFLPKESLLYFVNPYACIHWVFSGHSMAHCSYIHTAAYPLFQTASYACNKTISKIYDIPDNILHDVQPQHRFNDQRSRTVRFYFTKLSRKFAEDCFLKALALHTIQSSYFEVQIYLHYLDSNLDSPFDEECLNDCVVHEKSMLNLCHKQISFSGISSVGYELASVVDSHFILYDPRVIKPWQKKFYRLDAFIGINDKVSDVYDRMLSGG